jgi:8-amino-7-oxononanoate synthase
MFENKLSSLKEQGLLRALRTVEPSHGVKAVIDGCSYTLFCSNDYLGLSTHPDVRAAAKKAIDKTGSGSGAAPLISGNTYYHKTLKDDIAAFKGSDEAVLFGSGYLANIGIIPALAQKGDVILSDGLNHASIIDGCRLSKADVNIYRHCDISSLESQLKETPGYGHRFIVTEGVFGMDGEVAPLPEIMALAEKYGATVILDDAHATGVLGPNGRGTLEHFGLAPDNIVQMGTIGKALGSYGAFASASSDTVDWLINSARSFMFSTALPPSVCAAASASIQVIKDEPERLLRLRKNADRLRLSLIEAGFDVSGSETPIIPVIMGAATDAMRLSASLLKAGFYAPAIRPPTVPDGLSRIRFTVSALHTDEDIDSLIDSIKRLV